VFVNAFHSQMQLALEICETARFGRHGPEKRHGNRDDE
jgi:hypothetical protein